MKRRLLWGALFVLLCLVPEIGSAQEGGGAPWPPDPAAILSDAVEIVETEELAPAVQPFEVDNEARAVRLYDEQTGARQEIAYPDDFDFVRYDWETETGVLALDVVERRTYPEGGIHSTPWVLDISAGTLARHETPCFSWDDAPSSQVFNTLIDQQWVYHPEPDSAETYLCHIETGELRGPLPAEHFSGQSFWRWIYPSPTREWLLLSRSDERDVYLSHFYAYNLTTGVINDLGDLHLFEQFRFDQWIGETQAVLYNGELPEWAVHEYFALDMTQLDSLQRAINGRARFYPDPPRYIYLEQHYAVALHADLPAHAPCRLHIYTPERGLSSYELGYNCGGVVESPPGIFLALTFEGRNVTSSTVTRLDSRTGEWTPLLRGEFEALTEVSPDGQYALLLADDNGRVDASESDDPIRVSPNSFGDPYLAIYDLTTGEIVHTLPAEWTGYDYFHVDGQIVWNQETGGFENARRNTLHSGNLSGDFVVWLNETVLLVNSCVHTGVDPNPGCASHLVWLGETPVRDIRVDLVDAVFPDLEHFLARPDRGSRAVSLYNAVTGDAIPVWRDYNAGEYWSEYEIEGDDLVAVSVRPYVPGSEGPRVDDERGIRWTVRVPISE